MGYVERASLNEALVPNRNNGVQISDTAFDDRMGWAAGWFAEVDRTNINEIDGNIINIIVTKIAVKMYKK